MISGIENRTLNESEAKSLLEKLRSFSNLKTVTSDQLYKTCDLILEIENKITGRFAGDIYDYVFLYWMCIHASRRNKDLKQKSVDVLEIGTLFGASAILICKAITDEGMTPNITVVDPLDGYYMHSGKPYAMRLDSATRKPITPDVFWANIEATNVSENHFNLLTKLSQDKTAVAYSKKKNYDFVFIDGDHSFSGIQNDVTNHAIRLKRNGVLIIDNFIDKNWPEVAQGFFADDSFGNKFNIKCLAKKMLLLLRQNTNSTNLEQAVYLDIIQALSDTLCQSRKEFENLQAKYKTETKDK